MTVKEFYEITGGDYDRVTELLLKDELIKKFVLKFANDGIMIKAVLQTETALINLGRGQLRNGCPLLMRRLSYHLWCPLRM